MKILLVLITWYIYIDDTTTIPEDSA